MGTTGEDCDKKTVELEVMEVIWNNCLPTDGALTEILVFCYII